MKTSKTIVGLCILIAVLALLVAAGGLFWPGAGGPHPFTTLRGQTVQLDGRGLYRYDTLLTAASFRGGDVITLFVAVPWLVAALVQYRRGTLRGRLLLSGALVYHLYNAASLALSAAYNPFFLVYLVYFSASLFAFAFVLASVDLSVLEAHLAPGMPRRGIGVFMIATGVILTVVWLLDVIGPTLQGGVPIVLGSYTTVVTYVLDLGVIAPAVTLSGVYILRRAPLGYLLAAPLLMLNVVIGLVVATQTIVQRLAGVTLSTGQMIAFVGSFIAMSLVACRVTYVYLRNIKP